MQVCSRYKVSTMRCWSVELLCPSFIISVLVSCWAGCCPSVVYEATATEPTVRLPLDEAPHECGGFEWWYYTGRVASDDGLGYGVEAVIFRVPRIPLGILGEVWIAHYAVLDESTGDFTYDQVRFLGPSLLARVTHAGFDLRTPLVQITGSQGQDHLRAAMSDGSYALDLMLGDERGAVVHGSGGYVLYGTAGPAFYYSRPRMQATGTIQIAGRPQSVSGYVWFDRQWGRNLTNPWLNWDWFSLRLEDGPDVMLFVLHEEDGPTLGGTYIPSDGESYPLAADDFSVTPTSWWTSPHTGIRYPAAWRIQVIPQELKLTVVAVAEDQELDARPTTLNVYWEGLCSVTGTHGDQSVDGHAYVELANYPRGSGVGPGWAAHSVMGHR